MASLPRRLRCAAVLLAVALTAMVAPPGAATGPPCVPGNVQVCIKVQGAAPLASAGIDPTGNQVAYAVKIHRFAGVVDLPCAEAAVNGGPLPSPCAQAGGVPQQAWCPLGCLQGTLFVPAAEGSVPAAYLVAATLTAKVTGVGLHEAPVQVVCLLPTCADLGLGGPPPPPPAQGSADYNYERSVFGPTNAKSSLVGDTRVTFCDSGPVAARLGMFDCGRGGVGAILDVTGISQTTNYVSGRCDVKQTASSVFGIGWFSYACGTDRDNDGFVTNVDGSSTLAGDKNDGSWDWDGYDDDVSDAVDVGPGQQGSTGICFRADVDSSMHWGGYPTVAVWDTFEVFIAFNVDSTSVTDGWFEVDVAVNDTANAACTPSGHTHASWL